MNTRVENANGSLVIKDEAGKAVAVFDSDLGKWLNPDQMTDEQKSDLAPVSIDGFTKSNWSTVVKGVLFYRDAEGTAQLAYNPLTGEKSTLQELGTIELPLTDGGKFEMLSFETGEDLVKHIVSTGTVWGKVGNGTSDRIAFMNKFYPNRSNITSEDLALLEKGGKIKGFVSSLNGLTLPYTMETDKIFGVFLYTVDGGTTVDIKSGDNRLQTTFVSMGLEDLIKELESLDKSFFEASK
jgi:hypothetical protein